MVKVNTSYPDFSAGEVSPRGYGRFDLKPFYNGAARVENFQTDTLGSAEFRTGTVYVAKSAGNTLPMLWRFSYNPSLSYVLEFTNQKIRFYSNDGQVRETPQAITNITKSNPAVVTYSGADNYSNGDSVFIDGVAGMTEVNGREFVVANVNAGANTFELQGVNSTAYGAYTSGGEVAVITEVATPYVTADLFELKIAQKDLSLYIAHPSYEPRVLTVVSATNWTIAVHNAYTSSASPQNITGITQANPAVLTYAGADNFANGDRVFIQNVVGMLDVNDKVFTVANVNAAANTFQLQGINSTTYAAYTSGGTVTKIKNASFRTAGSYPAAVALYEQRLVYGGSTNNPLTLYFSRSGLIDNFITGPEVDDAIEYTVPAGGSIKWLRGTSAFLAIGCFSDVLQATGGQDDVITPTSISVKESVGYGVLDINPVTRGSQVFYVQNNGLVLRSFEYNFQSDNYVPINRNTIADHITASGVTQIAFQEGRSNVLWAVKANGTLIGMTLEEAEGLSGWHRHTTDGSVVSVASLPRENQYDQLWLAVKRGNDYFIEYLSDQTQLPLRDDTFEGSRADDNDSYTNLCFEAQKEYIHLDSSLSYYGDSIGESAGAAVQPADISGPSVTFTASAPVFTAGMVGRQIWRRSVTGAETGRAEITGFTSSTVVTCEVLEDFDSTASIPAGEWYLTTDAVSGLQHLEGREVSVVADGGQHPRVTVTNGIATLQDQSSVVHVGLPYTGWLVTLNLEGGGLSGTSQTKRKNVNAIALRLLSTLYAKVGVDYYSLDQNYMRTANMRMDRPPLPFTGDVKKNIVKGLSDQNDGGWSRSTRAIVCQDEPFPCNVQLVVPYMDVSD